MENTNEKIVVVEADEASRASLLSILESNGWEVSAFATAREGLDRLQHAGADLLLLDIDSCAADMLDVHEMLATIRGSSLTAMVRVIVLVCPGAENRALGLDLGADDAVSRPVEGVRLPRERAQRLCDLCPSGAISICTDHRQTPD